MNVCGALRAVFLSGMLATSLAACASSPASPDSMRDLQLTWHQARAAFPDQVGLGRDTIRLGSLGEAQTLAASGKLPVVIYMHGCTGLEGNDLKLMRKIARSGIAVVAPDSMARRYRPLQCSSRDKSGGYNLFVFDFRQAEINYAVQQLYEGGWADTDNLFLVGVSEGGLAVAHYKGDVIRARVITQWTCHGSTFVRGLDGPDDTSVLSIVRGGDPWYSGEGSTQAGDCGAFFGNRPGSESIVLRKGSDHVVIKDDAVVERIIGFLRQNLIRSQDKARETARP
ncbi:MAG: hypothetical protein ACE363_09840 [Alphaproteobacteria bacterium]